MSEREPVRIPKEVLEGLEAVRRHAGTRRGLGRRVIRVDKHPHEYARGVLDGFRAES